MSENLRDRPVVVDRINLLRSVELFHKQPEHDAVTQVSATLDDETELTTGTDSGRVLRISCPWATQAAINNILRDLRGWQYQPFQADGAELDPAAELMDGVTVNGVYSGIYGLDLDIGAGYSGTVYAPQSEELEQEQPFVSQKDRAVTRRFQHAFSELRITNEQIAAEVSERKSDTSELRASLSVEAGRITAEVNAREADTSELRASLDVETNRITAEVSERKSDTSDLRSSLAVATNRITAEVSARQSGDSALSGRLDVQAGQIAAKVESSGSDSSGSFEWSMTTQGHRWKADGQEVASISRGGLKITGEIRATSGTIGGFDILWDRLSYNSQDWGGYNYTGIYVGPHGFQSGPWDDGFHVDNHGHLYAGDGDFRGTIHAGRITYGEDGDDYFDGRGILDLSIDGGEGGKIRSGSITSPSIAQNTITGGRWGNLALSGITTANTNGGINNALQYAEESHNFLSGYTEAVILYAAGLYANTLSAKSTFYFKEHMCKWKQLKDGTWVISRY